MIDDIQSFVASLPTWLQWLGVMAAGAIPFVDSSMGAVIGVVAGLPIPVAIGAAVAGNILSMLVVVLGTHSVRLRIVGPPSEGSARRQRLRRTFDRYGVPGVSLLGELILPSQVTSAAMISFGASRNSVIVWQTIAITLWGTAFGLMAGIGIDLLHRGS